MTNLKLVLRLDTNDQELFFGVDKVLLKKQRNFFVSSQQLLNWNPEPFTETGLRLRDALGAVEGIYVMWRFESLIVRAPRRSLRSDVIDRVVQGLMTAFDVDFCPESGGEVDEDMPFESKYALPRIYTLNPSVEELEKFIAAVPILLRC